MLQYFPFAKPREGTEEAMKEIEDAFSSGKRFVFVSAPCGSGKSGISIAFARKYKATIWTPTKFLQTQYADTPEFNIEYVIKGKSNYKCGLRGQEDTPVDEAICCSSKIVEENKDIVPWPLSKSKKGLSRELKSKCADKGVCPYYSKIYKISTIPGAIMNYDLGLRIKKNPGAKYEGGVDMGNTLILDEAHQILSKINSVYGYKVTNTGVMRLFGAEGKRKRGEAPIVWINRLLLLSKVRGDNESDPKKNGKIAAFSSKMKSLIELDIENEEKFFVDDKKEEVDIKPLDLRYLKNKLFFPFSRVLLLSATFPNNIRNVLGITKEESCIVKIKSTFPPGNRRAIFPSNLSNMNARTVLSKESDQIKMLDFILAAHKNEKGIIHCANYKFFDQLKVIYSNNKRFLWVDRDVSKEDMFSLHAESKRPTILVSPAMLEGIDLKDDLARFGVLLKIPYPMLDEYTRRMNDIFPSWYENLTITNIVQGYGRQVRSKDDKAVFYILDGAFKMLLRRSKKLLPTYFMEGLKIGDAGRLAGVLVEKSKQANEGENRND